MCRPPQDAIKIDASWLLSAIRALEVENRTCTVQIASYSTVSYLYSTGATYQARTGRTTSCRGETSPRGAPPRECLPNGQNISESRGSTLSASYRVQRTMRIPAPRASSRNRAEIVQSPRHSPWVQSPPGRTPRRHPGTPNARVLVLQHCSAP